MKFKKIHQEIVKLKLMSYHNIILIVSFQLMKWEDGSYRDIILILDFQLIKWEDGSYRDIEVASIPNTALGTLPVLVPLYSYLYLYSYL